MIKKNVLITGVSSGIGRALTKKLIREGFIVWGISRRENLLLELSSEINNHSRFFFSVLDISKKGAWEKLVKKLLESKFLPEVVIFNAGILENDLEKGFDVRSTERMIDTNFYGVIRGVALLLSQVKPGTQFLLISSSSAFKGSGVEGVGYAASKAAVSIAFESFHQRYKNSNLYFKTVYFGPVATGMSPFKKRTPFSLTEDQAASIIIKAMRTKQIHYYYPKVIFLLFKFIKLLPSNLYFKLLSKHEDLRSNFKGL